VRPETVARWRLNAEYLRWEQQALRAAASRLAAEALRTVWRLLHEAKEDRTRLAAAELVLRLAEEPGEPEAEAGGPIVVTWGDGST
jgi:hypothetical protein